MKSVKQPIIQSDKTMNDTITYGTLELYIDTSYKPEHHRRQWGTMAADFDKLGLKSGEKVYFHYLSLEGSPQLPPDKWLVHPDQLYCVIRDKIEMLNQYLLVDIIEEPQKQSIIIQEKKKSVTRGIVRHTNHPELKDGDTVMFRDIMAFVNEIEGHEYYLMENRDAFCKIVNK